jgi:very-short-patch-repair endonuclease
LEHTRKQRRSIEADPFTIVTGVVKGTLVLTPQPPDLGGLKATLPHEVGREAHLAWGIEGGFSPERTLCARPIESIQPGDLVIGHDGQPHRVLAVHTRRYHGPMICIQHDQSDHPLIFTADQLVLTQRKVQQITPDGNWSGIPPDHFAYARTLRKEATPPERILWRFLRNEQLGVKFRRQHPIGPYIADFYTRDAGLVVEVDGADSHGSPEQAAYDAERDRFMQNLGLTILRIPARDVLRQTQSVLSLIMTYTAEFIDRIPHCLFPI